MSLNEKVLAALDGPYRELRDDTHINPNAVLVFTEATETVEAVNLWELPLRYPCSGFLARWSYECLGKLVAEKAVLYRQSKVAHELHEEDPSTEATCGTPVLVVPVRPGPFHRLDVRARIVPGA